VILSELNHVADAEIVVVIENAPADLDKNVFFVCRRSNIKSVPVEHARVKK